MSYPPNYPNSHNQAQNYNTNSPATNLNANQRDMYMQSNKTIYQPMDQSNYYNPMRPSPMISHELDQSPMTSIGPPPMNVVGQSHNMQPMASPLIKHQPLDSNTNSSNPLSQRSMGGLSAAPSPYPMTGTDASSNLNINKNSSEDLEYATKLRQLAKYVDPLRKLIFKIEKEDGQKKEIVKLKALLDILSNNSPNAKKVPLATLLKCEIVLSRQFDTAPVDKQSSNSNSPLLVSRSSTPLSSAAFGSNSAVPSPMGNLGVPPNRGGGPLQPLYPNQPYHMQSSSLMDAANNQYQPALHATNTGQNNITAQQQPYMGGQIPQYHSPRPLTSTVSKDELLSQRPASSLGVEIRYQPGMPPPRFQQPYPTATPPYLSASQQPTPPSQFQSSSATYEQVGSVYRTPSPMMQQQQIPHAMNAQPQANQLQQQQNFAQSQSPMVAQSTKPETYNIVEKPTGFDGEQPSIDQQTNQAAPPPQPPFSYSEGIRDVASQLYATLERMRVLAESSKDEAARMGRILTETVGPAYYAIYGD